MYQFVIPLGILTFTFLTLTLLMGLRLIKVKFKVHKTFGILTFAFALLHATLILYLYYFE